MKKKELLKQLIAGFQAGLPVEVYPRELMLPVDSNKIITVPGVRRCGKSSLFLLVINQLISEKGIRKEQILFLNFDDERLQFDAENLDEILQAYRELYPDISLKDVYMFFDEIQMAEDWQPFVRRVYEQECRHIFITGSNSNMLSSELATSLRGRTLQYEEFPLSFREYCSFVGVDTNYYVPEYRARIVNAFKVYLHQGGFPEVSLAIPMLKDRILQEYFCPGKLVKGILEHQSYLLTEYGYRCTGSSHAVNHDLPPVCAAKHAWHQSHEGLAQGALPCFIFTQYPDELAFLHIKPQPVKGQLLRTGIPVFQIPNLNK